MGNFEQTAAHFFRSEAAYGDRRSGEAASLLALALSGMELDEAVRESIVHNLADLAREHDLTPDDIQRILFRHDSSLSEAY